MTISGERTERLDIFCRVTGFTSDFLSFIDVELIRFFHGALQLYWLYLVREYQKAWMMMMMLVMMPEICCSDTLLQNTAEFVDKLMEIDEELCMQWSCSELVLAVMEAVKQIGYVALPG